MKVVRGSCRGMPRPVAREHFKMAWPCSESEQRKPGEIYPGIIGKWFIHFEDGGIFFHQSPMGDCVFGLRLEGVFDDLDGADAWVSRDHRRYRSPGLLTEKRLLNALVLRYLLGQ